MPTAAYRFMTPIVVVLRDAGQHRLVELPVGSVFVTTSSTPDCNGMIDGTCDGTPGFVVRLRSGRTRGACGDDALRFGVDLVFRTVEGSARLSPLTPSATDQPVHIRFENPDSADERKAITIVAFGGSNVAALVYTLRADGDALISLVAEREHRIVGHIMFSRMWIKTSVGMVSAVALAPVARFA